VSWVEVWLTAEAADRTRLEIEHIASVGDERRAGVLRLSGDRWCEADIASGNDKAAACARAERTIAAYTAGTVEPSG
jgi:hypothetical protein